MKKNVGLHANLDLPSDWIRSATSSAAFSDPAGVRHEVSAGQKNSFVEIRPLLEGNGRERRLSVAVTNRSRRPLSLHEVALIDVQGREGGALELGSPPCNWTAMGLGMSVCNGGVHDLCLARWEQNKYNFYFADYIVLGDRKTGRYLTFGFLTFARQHGVFRLIMEQDVYNLESFRALCEFDGYRLDPGETVETEQLHINLGDAPAGALARYADLVVAGVRRHPPLRPIAGWGTWDYYHARITEDDVLENARWLAARRDELPVEFIQLDHGFQRCEGDWLVTNERFPHGLKWLADEIKKLGFKPAIWLCPFLVDARSAIFREHPDWMIHNRAGRPVNVAGYTNRDVHILDCSRPEAREWVRRLGATVARDTGYAYVKLDGANVQPMAASGALADPKCTKAQAMRLGLQAFREGLGEDVVLLNGCLFGISVGIVDAVRVGPDVGARWDASALDKHHGERDNYPGPGFIARGIDAVLNLAVFHNRWWINDPDYLVVRQKGDHSELTLEEARTWASVVGLSNGLAMLSDRMASLENERRLLLEAVLPHYGAQRATSAAPRATGMAGARTLDFFENEQPTLMDLAVENESERWHVLAIINTRLPKRARDFEVAMERLGLDSAGEYLVFDFWARSFLGAFREKVAVRGLPPHHCRVLGIRLKQAVPQLLGTDLHLTQGGVEIQSAVFDSAARILVIKPACLRKQGRLYIHVPSGFQAGDAAGRQEGPVLTVPVKLDGSGAAIAIKFA